MNSTTDVQESKLSAIVNVLVKVLEPESIYLFGSRAQGINESYSDFDIAIEGHKKSFRTLRNAEEKIDYAIGIHSCDIVELEKTKKTSGN